MTDEPDLRAQIISHADAKAAGLKFYSTGNPCVHGHAPVRYVASRACVSCQAAYRRENCETLKSYLADRYKANRERFKIEGAAYRQANKEVLRIRKAAWHKTNREAIRLNKAAYYSANGEATRARVSAYRKENLDAIRAYRQANKDTIAVRMAGWRKANPEIVRAQESARRALKRKASGKHTAADIKDRLHRQKKRCAMCRASIKSGYHVDHIMPLKLGGSNAASNIQLLCAPCNLSKSAKHPIVFAQERGLLL